MKITRILDPVIYWAIVIMPFSVAIAPGLANAFIGIFSVLFIINRLAVRRPFSTDRNALLFFGLFLLASLISMVNSVSYNASLHGITKLLKYLLVFLVCSEEVRDKKHLQRIFVSICAGVSLASIDALWQMAFGYDFIRHNAIQSAIGLPRPTAAFPNPNVFGIYLTALVPFILGFTFFYFRGRNRLLAALAGGLGLVGICLTLSRGAGLAVYLAILYLCFAKRKLLAASLLIGLLVISPFLMPRNIKQWAKDVNYNPLVFMLNQDRVSIYNNTLNMIKHHPFIGVGVNTFSRNYGKYKTVEAEKYAHTPDTIYAHNIYLHMAGEIGLLGLFAFLLFLLRVFRQVLKAGRMLRDGYLNVAALSLSACLLAFLINGLTETSLYYSRVAMVFWYLIGVSLALPRLKDSAIGA